MRPGAVVATASAQPAVLLPPATSSTRRVGAAIGSRVAAVAERRAFPIVALAGIYCVSVLIYLWVGSKHLVPSLIPDEIYYGKLSQNLAWGNGFQWRGDNWGLPPLWPTVLSLAWHGGSVPHGYSVAKAIGAVLAPTAAIPVWLVARSLVGPRLALVPAVLSVAGAWMLISSFLVSENVSYPLSTAALACTVMAVRDTRMRWMLLSAGFGVLAAFARTQMLVLPVILVVALCLDVLRQPRGQRLARFDARPRALWLGLVAVVIGGLLAFIVKPNLSHYDLLAHHASVGAVLSTAARHVAASIVLFGFIPVAVVVALMARPANWRDEKVGPVLVTIAAAAVVLYPVVARFEAWATFGSPVDRYAMYLAPLTLIALVIAPGHIGRKTGLAAAVGVVAALFLAPTTLNRVEEPGLFGVQKRMYDLAPFFQHHLKLAVVLFALPVTIGGLYALSSRRHATAGFAIVVALVAGVLVMQSWTSQATEIAISARNSHFVVPPQYDWVDKHANGPVGILAVGKRLPWSANLDIDTEFFNRQVKWYYATLDQGNGACDVDLAARGLIKLGAAQCPEWPREWVLSEGPVQASLRGQRILATSPHSGLLVRVPSGPPRIFSLVEPPCSRYGCTGELRLGLYLDKPAEVDVTFGSAATQHRIQTGSQIRVMPAGKPSVFKFRVPKGDQAVNLPVDWQTADGSPPLASVIVRTGAEATRIW